ncbi:MAG: DUF6164 family protein [Mariprofundaceae bacterium]
MAALLFKLRNVPDDEADEIRQLLSDHAIDFYETSSGSWGISMPAIWLHDKRVLSEAKGLLDTYQQQRQQKARLEHRAQCQRGEQRTVLDKVKEAPLQAFLYLLAALFMLYLSVMPFLSIFRVAE